MKNSLEDGIVWLLELFFGLIQILYCALRAALHPLELRAHEQIDKRRQRTEERMAIANETMNSHPW